MTIFMHPKMQYTYVGIDSHKDTHTAVFLDCFFTKLGEIIFDNLPSKFPAFLKNAIKLQQDGTVLLFGLEDISMYGRTLAVFLKENGQQFKHVNSILVWTPNARQGFYFLSSANCPTPSPTTGTGCSKRWWHSGNLL
jgi:hypothetical protein